MSRTIKWTCTAKAPWQWVTPGPAIPISGTEVKQGTITLSPDPNIWSPCIKLVYQGVAYGDAYVRYFIENGVEMIQARTQAENIWTSDGDVGAASSTPDKGGIVLLAELVAPSTARTITWTCTAQEPWQWVSKTGPAVKFTGHDTRTGTITLSPDPNVWAQCIKLVYQGVAYGDAFVRYFIDNGADVIQARTQAENIWTSDGGVGAASSTPDQGGIVLLAELVDDIGAPPLPNGPVVQTEPPPVREEIVPVAPSPLYIWAGGYWCWEAGQYVWSPGYWMLRRPGFDWERAHWEVRPGGWGLVPGYWRKT